jgi:hypothetical protein
MERMREDDHANVVSRTGHYFLDLLRDRLEAALPAARAPLDSAGETSVKSVILFPLIPCAFGQQPAIQSIQNAASSVAAPIVPVM